MGSRHTLVESPIFIRKNPDIVIKPADKGSAVVIMDRQTYIQEGLRQLENKDFYVETPKDLTYTHNTLILNEILKLQQSGQISAKTALYL